MQIGDLTYHRPETLAEASALAGRLGSEACFLAGGTELLPDFTQARDRATHLIDLRRIEGLREIHDDAGTLVVGAMAPLGAVAGSALVRERFPALAEAALTVAGVQIRNHATIGGNFCRAVPCADTPPICIAGEATLTIRNGDDARIVAASEFFRGPRRTVMQPGDVLTEIRIPPQPASSGAAYQRFSLRRGSALAVASVAARVVVTDASIADARVVLGAVAPIPLLAETCGRWLRGRAPTAETFARAAAMAASEARPISDVRGTAAFRTELVDVLTRRALRDATRRAGNGV